MLPSLASRIVEEYSRLDDLVVDPMAGIGTTLIEAATLGRRAVGVELENRWSALAAANLDHVLTPDQRLRTEVRPGDARCLTSVLGDLSGKVDLIATSPPYACDVANVDRNALKSGDKRLCVTDGLNYSENKNNVGHARGKTYETEMLAIYRSCFDALRPGGFLVTVTKNMRNRGKLVDLAGITVRLGHEAGFRYFQHVISLLCGVRNGDLIGRPSFWQQRQTSRARAAGYPIHLVAHEDVVVLRKPEVANV